MDIKEVNLDGSMFLDSEEKTYAKSATNYYNHVAKTVVFFCVWVTSLVYVYT